MTSNEPHSGQPRLRRLFIRLGEDISFAHYDPRQPESFSFFPYESTPAASRVVNLRGALDTLPPEGTQTTDAQVLVGTGATTLVPLAHFREEDCATLYAYCCPEPADTDVFYDTLPAANAVLLFGLQRQVVRMLKETFASVHYVSALTPLLRHFAERSTAGGRRLYAYIDGASAHLSAFDGGRLLMANSYPARHATDIAYFALNMARRLAFDLEADTCYVTGARDTRERVAQELRNYIRHVNPINPSAEFNRHPATRSGQVPYDLTCFLLGMV